MLQSDLPMQRAGEILSKVLRRLDRPEAAQAWLTSAWPAIVGESVAMHARPLNCVGGCLELAADGRAWQQQIEAMRSELLERVNQSWGATLVHELKFVSPNRGAARPSRAVDNNYKPFIRRRHC